MKSANKKRILGVMGMAFGGIALAAYHAKAVPHVFQSGQKIKASEINENFAAVSGGGVVVLTTPGVHSITPPSGYSYARIEVIGGGAGGVAGVNAVLTDGTCGGVFGIYPPTGSGSGQTSHTTIQLAGISTLQVTVGAGGSGASVGPCDQTTSVYDGASPRPVSYSSPIPPQYGAPSKVLANHTSGTFLVTEATGGYASSYVSLYCGTAPSPVPPLYSGAIGQGGRSGQNSAVIGGGCPTGATAGFNGSNGGVIIRYFN